MSHVSVQEGKLTSLSTASGPVEQPKSTVNDQIDSISMISKDILKTESVCTEDSTETAEKTDPKSEDDNSPKSVEKDASDVKLVVLQDQEPSSSKSSQDPNSSLDSFDVCSEPISSKTSQCTLQQLAARSDAHNGNKSNEFTGVPKIDTSPLGKRLRSVAGEYESGDRVTLWNSRDKRKIAGNAAPLWRNIKEYFTNNPHAEVYNGQDIAMGRAVPRKRTRTKVIRAPTQDSFHVPIWNKKEKRKFAGNAAPLRRNLEAYLANHPDCEEYTGQDIEMAEKEGNTRIVRRQSSSRASRNRSSSTISYKEVSEELFLMGSFYGDDLDESFEPMISAEIPSTAEHTLTDELDFLELMASTRASVESPMVKVEGFDDVDAVTAAMDVGGFSTPLITI